MSLIEIISGGQTGAERAALHVAMRYELPYSGWCPKGRKAEDGMIADRYRLNETPGPSKLTHIGWNVKESEGTAIFTLTSQLIRSCKEAALFAETLGKPWIHISQSAEWNAARSLQEFVEENKITRLNVTGSWKSMEPGIYRWVYDVIEGAFFSEH
jgi:hypothetical protein